MLRLPLPAHFRYVHEPLPVGEGIIPVLGHEELAKALRERLVHSRGGTFLVTGFQGVGKSTLVNRALAETAAAWEAQGRVLLVTQLNLARSMTPDQLLFAVVRRIFEELDDRKLLPLLPRDVQHSLPTAYTRTSLSFTQTQSETSERTGSLGLGPQPGPLAVFSPLGVSRTRARSSATEAAFLAYSETDVEHDLVRIIQLLDGSRRRADGAPGVPERRRPLRGRGGGPRGRAAHRMLVHPVVVLDEIDKLTDGRPEAMAEFEELLRRLKGVLTTQGAHFLVVAGPDLHDRAVRWADGCNGVYENVFSWHAYVPCLWDAPERLIDGLLPPLAAPGATPRGTPLDSVKLMRLTRYLRFKAKGIPRRLLQEFNSFVSWEGTAEGPCLRVDQANWARVNLYSRLEEITGAAVARANPVRLARTPIDDDRWRMGGYQVVEWALHSEGRSFAATDVATDVEPAFGLGAPGIDQVLRHLTEASVLEVTRTGDESDTTVYGNAPDAHLTYYKLTDAYRWELARLVDSVVAAPVPDAPAQADETALADEAAPRRDGGEGLGKSPGTESAEVPIDVLATRYALLALINQGGMGAVYRGRDLLTGQPVAVKMMHVGRQRDEEALSWFRREAEISRSMHHPNIVNTIDVLLDPAKSEPALIQELVEGPSLAARLAEEGILLPSRTVLVARQIGQALDYLHDAGLARLDVKPSNVLLHPVRGVVLTDLGRALRVDDDAEADPREPLVGTPSYMAPEQLSGGRVDIRSDLYSLGVLMIHCLTGRMPGEGTPIAELQLQRLHGGSLAVVDDLPVSAELGALITRMTARFPDDRFATPSAFQDALDTTPEGLAEFGLVAREETTTMVFPRLRPDRATAGE
ncbi:protein kinase [Streptomyces sp. B6B3]|uniref:protein kinase domain-containing protein n=1 Tax=Streptomyces sp. B6B3 TaxID=3153570 RepID=UPI00325EB4F1